MMRLVREWCGLACERVVVTRGLKYAVVVGAVLVAINYGDEILRGNLERGDLVKIALTVVVPYCVSALSSVGAIRHLRQTTTPTGPAPLRPSSPPGSR